MSSQTKRPKISNKVLINGSKIKDNGSISTMIQRGLLYYSIIKLLKKITERTSKTCLRSIVIN